MSVLQDLVWVCRRLLRRPASAAGIVITLALGIGISVAMFSVLHGVVLRALPYPDGERVVIIHGENLETGVSRAPLTAAEAVEALADAPGFEHTAHYTWGLYTVSGGDTPRNITSLNVSADYFSVFGVPAALGRTLTPDDVAENRPVAVLSHAAWLQLTGGDPAAIGQTLAFQEGAFELVGVLPEAFAHPGVGVMMYRPVYLLDDSGPGYVNARYLSGLGRLPPGSSAVLADQALQARLAAVHEAYGMPQGEWRLRHVPLIDELVGDVRHVLLMLFAVTLLVLLTACSTAASLVSIRLEQRRAELAIRRALGASDTRIGMDVAAELLVLVSSAALGGVLLAYLVIEALQPLAAGNLPRADNIGIGPTTLWFAAAAACGSVLMTGVLPLLRALRAMPAGNLRGRTGREVAGGRRIALLPAAGVGLATLALVTALTLAMSLMRLGDVDPGFRTENTAALQLFRSEVPQFMEQAFEELRSVPGVRDVAAVSAPPLSVVGTFTIGVTVQGRELAEPIPTAARHASAGYHDFLETPLVAGRDISERDLAGARNVVVINEALARLAFGGTDPLGQALILSSSGERIPFEVVGVAADTRNTGLRSPADPELVVSVLQQRWSSGITLLVDSAAVPPGWLRTLEEAVWRIDANQAIPRSFMLADDLDAQMRDTRFFASATGWFAVLALVLGAAGINAVVAAMQRRRTREIGLRLALGAAPRQAARLVLANAARIVGLGLAVGALLAVPALAWLQDQLFGVDRETFWALFGLTTLVLTISGLAAAGWPAWRASRVAPMEVLRHE